KPIELISGHEVIALRHLSRNPQKTEVEVATQVSRGSFLVTRFGLDRRMGLRLIEEGLKDSAGGALQETIHARDLAETLILARSRRTLRTFDDIAQAAPAYFGTRDYALFTTAHQPNTQSGTQHQ